jgi:rhamnose transport system permease protein
VNVLARDRSQTLLILCGLWIVVIGGLAVLAPGAFALSTFTTVLQFSTLLALVSLGQSLVILCGGGGIDWPTVFSRAGDE